MKLKAIVSGHSKGLGKGIVQALLEREISVLGLSRSRLAECKGLDQLEIDLSDSLAVCHFAQAATLSDFVGDAQCILLINNAGLIGPVAPVKRQAELQVALTVALNVTAPLILSAAIAKLSGLLEKRVVHISSGAGRSAYPGWSVYCATKAALDHHARATALDADPTLKIASLAPGVIDTQMQETIRGVSVEDFPHVGRFLDLKKEGQLSSPDRAGQAIVNYVLSEKFGSQPVDDLRS